MLPVDAEGNPLRNGITCQDSRSIEELHYIVETIGYDRFVKIVGGRPAVAFLPNKILWFKSMNRNYLQRQCVSFRQVPLLITS